MTRLRSIMNIKWHQRIPDTAVLSRTKTTSIHTMLMQQHQVRWAGHLVRMDDSRIPKQLFYGKLSEVKRSQGGQKKRYKDSLKASRKQLQIDTSIWENAALDRPKWRSEITMGAMAAEKRRIAEAKEKRRWRRSSCKHVYSCVSYLQYIFSSQNRTHQPPQDSQKPNLNEHLR